jgi:exocyst complex component 7
LLNRDLLKAIGEFEEYQPVEARPIREIRSIFECIGGHGYTLGPVPKREPAGLASVFGIPPNEVKRTEKVGSGCYSSFFKVPLKSGFPQLDAYSDSRRLIAYTSMDNYYRRVKADRKKRIEKYNRPDVPENELIDEADAAARDAVRCLEHAMVVVAGEKNVYRNLVAPVVQAQSGGEKGEDGDERPGDDDEDDDEKDDEGEVLSPYFRKACVAAYAYIVGSVVDRSLDIIETVFLKEGGIGQSSGSLRASSTGGSSANVGPLTVSAAASAAAAGLRMLDGVRMLGPSLAKLSEIPVGDGITDANSSLAAILCISIHRTSVKNTARTLENLAKAIQDDPLKGPLHRPKDASVSSVSRDVVKAIRLISPFVSAYRSVSKRR